VPAFSFIHTGSYIRMILALIFLAEQRSRPNVGEMPLSVIVSQNFCTAIQLTNPSPVVLFPRKQSFLVQAALGRIRPTTPAAS